MKTIKALVLGSAMLASACASTSNPDGLTEDEAAALAAGVAFTLICVQSGVCVPI